MLAILLPPLTLAASLGVVEVPAGPALDARFAPSPAHPGDLVTVHLPGVARTVEVEGTLGGRAIRFFPLGPDQVAIAGIDVETPPGTLPWEMRVVDRAGEERRATGALPVVRRAFAVQRLTVAPRMADLDPETLRRAEAEAARLRGALDEVTPERLWEGGFLRPVPGEEPGRGFGARRVINGQPRAPHTGADFQAAVGTPIRAANRGRVVLVGDFFFPGRLVVLDHGRGFHTFYFHLDRIDVTEGTLLERGAPLGTVGSTGRVTGPHLHLGAAVERARVDPNLLFCLPALD